jgi:hypothetical protein
MKLIHLLVYVKTLVLVAWICVADQSRGLRDDQKNESGISEITASAVLPEASSQGFDVTHDVVTKQKLSLDNQIDRKLNHKYGYCNRRCRRLHEHLGPAKVRELCLCPISHQPTPTPKPTPRPTKDCCRLCWKCKREQKKIAEQDKANAAAHAGTPASKPTTSCMSGYTRVGIQSINETLNNLTLFKTIRDLTVGDTIRGLDKDLNPADCSVQAIGTYGNGMVYGNYTNDHYILNPAANAVLPNGNSSVLSEVDKYSVLTTCPVGLDESGVGFTPFDSDFFGANTVSWSDYVRIHQAIVDIVKVVGSFVFSPQTYTSLEDVSEYTNAMYATLLTCTKDPTSCDAFEMASLELVEMSMTEESRMKVRAAFPHFGQLNMPGSIASSVTNGASVKYSWVPDWTGLNKGCVSAPLGSIETYTPKYDEQSACCSFHYNWDLATCMGTTTVFPPSGWYPVSSSSFNIMCSFYVALSRTPTYRSI